MQQKLILILSGILIVLIIALGWFYVSQTNKTNELEQENAELSEQTTKDQSNQTQKDMEKQEQTEEGKMIEKEAQSNQKEIVNQLAPESDLNDFDIPDSYLNAGELLDEDSSPAYNRSGRILAVSAGNNTLTFLDYSLGKEKEYQIQVTQDTHINIYITVETYDNEENYEIVGSSKSTEEDASISDLKAGDLVNISTYEMFSDTTIIAKSIEARRTIKKFQE